MKILMLGWELPPHNSGGMGVACYELCKSLANKKVDIEFIIPFDGNYDKSFMNIHSAYPMHVDDVNERFSIYDSSKFSDVVSSDSWFNINGQLRNYELAVAKLVEVLEFDVIHAHDWLTFRAALRAKEVSGKPLILHLHSVESDRAGGKRGNPFVHEIEETAMLIADRIIAVSQRTKEQIISDYGIPADKIEVVHNSINANEVIFQDLAKNSYPYLSKMRQNGYKVIVNVGRMTIQKSLINLVYAAKEVIQRAPKTLFLFVGDGEQYIELVNLAAQLGISKNVLFAGFQRGQRWRDSYRIGNLFVMPSISEPFGLTALEAAACNTPALISKQSGVAEVFKNCLKVDYWDINEMANKMTAIVQNDSMANELSKNAFSEYRTFSWGKSADKVIDLYNQHLEMAMV